jgi:hypothetical protein
MNPPFYSTVSLTSIYRRPMPRSTNRQLQRHRVNGRPRCDPQPYLRRRAGTAPTRPSDRPHSCDAAEAGSSPIDAVARREHRPIGGWSGADHGASFSTDPPGLTRGTAVEPSGANHGNSDVSVRPVGPVCLTHVVDQSGRGQCIGSGRAQRRTWASDRRWPLEGYRLAAERLPAGSPLTCLASASELPD